MKLQISKVQIIISTSTNQIQLFNIFLRVELQFM